MKTQIALALVLFVALPAVALARGSVHVRGYFRQDGTYVQPSYRSAPDHSYNDNWSTRPNTNPYTGKEGTNRPTWNDRPPQHSNPYSPPAYNNPYESSPRRSTDSNRLRY